MTASRIRKVSLHLLEVKGKSEVTDLDEADKIMVRSLQHDEVLPLYHGRSPVYFLDRLRSLLFSASLC